MTRRTLLVPLFAAAFILAPSEIAGTMNHGPGWKPALPALGSPADSGRTGFYRWNPPPHRQPFGPRG